MKKNNIMAQDKYLSQGFTLIELIIAIVISLVVMSGIYAYCNSYHKSHTIQTRVNEMNTSIRIAMNKMVGEIRMAGYKTGTATSVLMTQTATWISGLVPTSPYTVSIDNDNLFVTNGASDPEDDMITFVYGDTDPTTLAAKANAPTSIITLSLSGSQTARKFSVGDIIYIGYGNTHPSSSLEYGKITSISGSQLVIDTDPGSPTLNLVNTYEAGTEVGLMKVVTYAVFNDDNDPGYSEHTQNHPILKRRCNTGAMEPFVEEIESLEINEISNDIRITLVARTSKEDSDYINPDFGDHYRRRSLTSIVQVRNR